MPGLGLELELVPGPGLAPAVVPVLGIVPVLEWLELEWPSFVREGP